MQATCPGIARNAYARANKPGPVPPHCLGCVFARPACRGRLDAKLALQTANFLVLRVRFVIVLWPHSHALEESAVCAWDPTGTCSLCPWLGASGGSRSRWLALRGPVGSAVCLLRHASSLASVLAAELLRLGATAPRGGPGSFGHNFRDAFRGACAADRVCAQPKQHWRFKSGALLRRMCNPIAQTASHASTMSLRAVP